MNYDAAWFEGIQRLKPGDPCEVRFPARTYWMKARLIRNGGSYYWEAELTERVVDDESRTTYPIGHRLSGLYAEYVRAIDTTEQP